MSIVVTGGAGFIGSSIVRTLNDLGKTDIIIVDNISSTNKWMNLRNKKYLEYIHKSKFLEKIHNIENIDVVIHMGAQSSTTEKNFDYLWENNFEYSKFLWDFCAKKNISFIYASSAATYGDGKDGFDDNVDIDRLSPLNAYGYSKHLFDLWVKHQANIFPRQYVGLKFFNVYGPNEYNKGSMASMVYHGYNQIKTDGEIRLFKSYKYDYPNGGQMRDFIYVKDICNVIMWFLKHKDVSGLFNIGTGNARSFEDLAKVIFNTLNMKTNIKYIDMPENIRNKYQYFTKAEIEKLKKVGCNIKFKDIEEGVQDYVQEYLEGSYQIY